MPATILPSFLPPDSSQRGILQTLFGSPAYSLLKEVLVAHCIKHQVEAANLGLYEHNNASAAIEANRAKFLNGMIDVLDDLAAKEDEWFTVKLEHRR